MPTTRPNHGRIDGPDRDHRVRFHRSGARLPLIERHFTYDPRKLHVIEPSDDAPHLPRRSAACTSSTLP